MTLNLLIPLPMWKHYSQYDVMVFMDRQKIANNLVLYLKQIYPHGGWIRSSTETFSLFASPQEAIKKTAPSKIDRKPLTLTPPTPKKVTPKALPIPKTAPPPKESPANIEPRTKLEPLKPPQPAQIQLREKIQNALPNLFLHPKPLDDREAKRVRHGWKQSSALPEIPVFISKELSSFAPFLTQIATAIDRTFSSSALVTIDDIEKENTWNTVLANTKLKLILCPDVIVFGSINLITHYMESPGKLIKSLGNIPLLLLPDPAIYFKDPALKKALWRLICQTLDPS